MTSHFADASAELRITHARAALWLTLLALLMFLPGFARLQPMDRDEPRFAQATKQMLETRDFVDIRFQDEARHKKPVGIYWLQAAAVSSGEALGVSEARRTIWLYRLPSLLAAIGAVLATYWAALAFLAAPGAFLAAALFAATILLGAEARLAKTDAVVALTVVAAMGALARVWRRPDENAGWGTPLIFWSAVALGVLVKGPITPMVPFLAALVLSVRRRSLRWLAPLRPLWGLALVLLVVAPWLTMILLKTKGAFLADSVGKDMLGKVASGKEAHGAPPGTYLLAFWLTAWPLAPFLALSIPAAWRGRAEAAAVFLLAWALPSWLVFEATPTKLPHYVLPLYPALAILAAWAITERGAVAARGAWARVAQILVAFVPLAIVAGAIGGATYLGVFAAGAASLSGLVGLVLALTAVGLGLSAARRLAREDEIGAALRAVGSAAALSALAFAIVMPGAFFEPFRLSPRLAEAGRAALNSAGCADASQIATTGYREPSLVFLTRTDLVMTNGEGAGRLLAGGGCALAFVDKSEAKGLESVFAGSPTSRVKGINLNGGRALDIGVYVSK